MSFDMMPDQLMQIKFMENEENVLLEFFISANALHIEVYDKKINDLKKYIMYLSPIQKKTITLQTVLDCIFLEVQPFNKYDQSKLKFTLFSAYREPAVTSKTILELPIEQVPLSTGEYTYRVIKECGICKKKLEGFKKKCGSCEAVYYCGIECQTMHWSLHKHFCYKDCGV
jgi:hypothetical protein